MHLPRLIGTLTLLTLTCVPAMAQDRAREAEETRQKISQYLETLIAPEMVGRNPEKDLEMVDQLQPLRTLLGDIEKSFSQEIATENQPYRNLAGSIRYLREKLSEFENAVGLYASLDAVQADADHIVKMTKMAVEYQAPAYFREGNDISNRTASIRLRLRMLEKLKPKSEELSKAKAIEKNAAAEVLSVQKKLLKEIVDQNELPEDSYTSADRKELLKLIDDTWKKQGGVGKIVKAGIIGNNWTRSQAWEIQNRTLYKVDRSRIQGFILIAHDANTLACRRIQIQKDHTDNDRLSAWTVSNPKEAPEPIELVSRSKLK